MPCLPEWAIISPNQSLQPHLLPRSLCLLHCNHTGFLAFWRYASGSLHFLSPLLYTSPPPPDLCLTDKLTSLKCLLKCRLPRGAPDSSPSNHYPLIMLHFFSSPAIILYLLICFLFFFLECNLNYLKSGTLSLSCCIPMPISTSSIK